ncbi:hypothetical protein F5879DRAFT_923886 [Lentinula edodes]|nr:hypothetical protein F5879DRAFT_923886 [Lentinula edodes]
MNPVTENSSAFALTTTTQYLKFKHFELGLALEEDNKCSMDVERLTLEDEGVEFEEVEECGTEENLGECLGLLNVKLSGYPYDPSNSQCPFSPQTDPIPSLSQRGPAKRSRKTDEARRKRSTAAKARDSAAGLKELGRQTPSRRGSDKISIVYMDRRRSRTLGHGRRVFAGNPLSTPLTFLGYLQHLVTST